MLPNINSLKTYLFQLCGLKQGGGLLASESLGSPARRCALEDGQWNLSGFGFRIQTMASTARRHGILRPYSYIMTILVWFLSWTVLSSPWWHPVRERNHSPSILLSEFLSPFWVPAPDFVCDLCTFSFSFLVLTTALFTHWLISGERKGSGSFVTLPRVFRMEPDASLGLAGWWNGYDFALIGPMH